MDKAKLGFLLAGLTVGAVGSNALNATAAPAPNQLEIVNMKLVRSTQADGGVQWSGRTCAYETGPDAGRAGEPCWQVTVPGPLIVPVITTLLDQKP